MATTQRYMHLSPAAKESAIRLLDQPAPKEIRGEDTSSCGSRKTNVLAYKEKMVEAAGVEPASESTVP